MWSLSSDSVSALDTPRRITDWGLPGVSGTPKGGGLQRMMVRGGPHRDGATGWGGGGVHTAGRLPWSKTNVQCRVTGTTPPQGRQFPPTPRGGGGGLSPNDAPPHPPGGGGTDTTQQSSEF